MAELRCQGYYQRHDAPNECEETMNRNLGSSIIQGIFKAPRGGYGKYAKGNLEKNSGQLGRDIHTHSTSVNGNIDTVRKPVKRGKIKK